MSFSLKVSPEPQSTREESLLKRPHCVGVRAAIGDEMGGLSIMRPSDLPEVSLGDPQEPHGREQFGVPSSHCEILEKTKTALTIHSMEVPTLQKDIPNFDWFYILSALGWPQSRSADLPKIQINILETGYAISSTKHSPELDDSSGFKLKDHFKSIPELRWINDSAGDDSNRPKATHCYQANIEDLLEPRELLQLEELDSPNNSCSVIHAHMLGHIEYHQHPAGKELECPSVMNVDIQLLTKRCASKLEYDKVECGPIETLYGILEEKNIKDSQFSSGTDDIQETSTPDKALISFEVSLFCDKFLSVSSACIHSLTCDNEVAAEQIALESLPEGLNAHCFESLMVMPELRADDRQFQSLSTPMLVEWPSEELRLAIATSVCLNCKPSPVTATDWLYLDWHFAHGRNCNEAECFKLQGKLEENLRPIEGSNIGLNSFTDWLKVALKLVGLESDPRRGIHSEENQISKDYNEPNSAQERDSLVYQDGRHAYTRLCQRESTIEEGKRTDRNLGAVKKGNLESRSLEVSVVEAECFSQDNPPTERRSFQTSRDDHQNFQKNDSETVLAEFIFKLPGLQDAQRSSRSRTEPGSASTLDDLTCFVQARKGLLQNNCHSDLISDGEERILERMNDLPTDTIAQTTSGDDAQRSFSSFEHVVELSVEIHYLICTLASDYHRLIVAKEILGKKIVEELNIPGNFGFDSQENSCVMNLIETIASEQPTQQRQVILRGLTALHVLRHTALNLCTYGIQVAHLYLENMFDRISFLEELILNSRVDLEDAYNKVERGIYQDHPKLHHLEKLLKGRNSSQKILLIADRRAFFTLYKKLLSSGFTPYQLDRKAQYLRKGLLLPDAAVKLKEDVTHALTFSNCLLVPYSYITDSFPVENFTMVIQYACSGTDAAAYEVLQRGRYERHIFKDGVNPENVNPITAHETAQIQADDSFIIKQAQDLLSDKILKLLEPTDYPADTPGIVGTNWPEPKEQASSKTFEPTACDLRRQRRMPAQSSPDGCVTQDHERSIGDNQFTETGYEMILVANISQQLGQRLTQRRSSYQKILGLEKQRIQVVERELRLPVDLVVSPAICLVIYTRSMLEKSFEHERSLLRTEVDIILKAISFAYRDCILIFEGPADFTSGVLDVLCDIHATATWLELEVQCFISNGAGITDKIVMKSIEAARRTKPLELYPAMTETPTIAEAFLTEFPTINPLTAHAVLSSGCPLRKFFSMSLEKQYALVQDSGVPRQSLELFKAQCAYREVGNSMHSDSPDFGSQSNHRRIKFDSQKDVASLSCERIMSHTNFPEDKDLVTYERRALGLHINNQLCVRETMLESWNIYPDLPTIFEENSISQTENSRKISSFVEAECFHEFPPASEVTGDSKLQTTAIEIEEDDLPPEFNIFGHQSNEDQDFFLPEEKSNVISNSNDDYLPSLLPKRLFSGQDERFLASVDKLKASFNSWDEHGRDTEDYNIGTQKKTQQSYRSPLALGPLANSGEFDSYTEENGGQDVPCGFKSNCKGQLRQTSLDRYRYQSKNPNASGNLPASLKFPRVHPRNKERQLPTPQASIFTGYVPVDKKTKKLLGLTRRGSDRQQRLVWINRTNDIHDVSKRQKKDSTSST